MRQQRLRPAPVIDQSTESYQLMFQRFRTLYFETLYQLKRYEMLLFGALLFFGSALMLMGGVLIYRATLGWPSAEGKIIQFDVLPIPGKVNHVRLDILYDYRVDEKQHLGTYLSSMSRPGKVIRLTGQRKQSQYRPGNTVSVIYDPSDPSHSYLESPHLFWDVLLVPVSAGALGAWLLFLFIKTRRRKVPPLLLGQMPYRFASTTKWHPIIDSVVDLDFIVLRGVMSYSAAGSLIGGWPSCQVALVASPNHFAIIPGPFTKRGALSSIFMLGLEFSISRFWVPVIHSFFFAREVICRRRHWRLLREQQFEALMDNADSIDVGWIDDAIVYGIEPNTQRFWYRLPGKKRDEFLCLRNDKDGRNTHQHHANELVAYVSMMQKAKSETTMQQLE